MSTLPGPYPVPKDSITPYKVTFDRLMRTLSELQFQADVLAENRAAGAVFDGVPFLLSMDSSDQQLTDHLGAGISTGIDAIRYMQEAATQTLGWVAPEATPYSASPEASAPAESFAQPQPGSPASTDSEAEDRSAHSGAAFGL